MKKILLIEDDESFGYILSEYLSLHNYKMVWSTSGEEGLKQIEQQDFDLCIFDIMLPGKNGYEVAEIVKEKYPTLPFIFLSAKSLKIDKLKGYKVGGDDYITKPVEEEILLAKIKALLLRSENSIEKIKEHQIGKYLFNASLQTLIFEEEQMQLTKREAALLELLCERENQLLARDYALRKIWNATDEFSRKSMDVFISHLRKYLSKDEQIQIKNIHGKGFILSVK